MAVSKSPSALGQPAQAIGKRTILRVTRLTVSAQVDGLPQGAEAAQSIDGQEHVGFGRTLRIGQKRKRAVRVLRRQCRAQEDARFGKAGRGPEAAFDIGARGGWLALFQVMSRLVEDDLGAGDIGGQKVLAQSVGQRRMTRLNRVAFQKLPKVRVMFSFQTAGQEPRMGRVDPPVAAEFDELAPNGTGADDRLHGQGRSLAVSVRGV